MVAVRAIRFEGAGNQQIRPDAGAGPLLTPGRRLAFVAGPEAIRQSILLLLTTAPGERVMRPDYGCPLHRLLFSPNDATTAGLAIHYVRQAIARFEPRVEIVRLNAEADPLDVGGLLVTLDYRIRATGETARLDLAIALDGGGGA